MASAIGQGEKLKEQLDVVELLDGGLQHAHTHPRTYTLYVDVWSFVTGSSVLSVQFRRSRGLKSCLRCGALMGPKASRRL